MQNPLLHIDNNLTAIGLVPAPVQVLRDRAKLDDKIARQVLRPYLPPLFLPQSKQCCFVITHNDAGVRAANEVAAI